MFILAERGGDLILEPISRPLRSQESITDVSPFLDKHFVGEGILLTDRAGCYITYCRENPEKDILHAIVNHKTAKEFGMSWVLVLDKHDGPEFAEFSGIGDDFYVLEVRNSQFYVTFSSTYIIS